MSAKNTLAAVVPFKTCRKCQAQFSGLRCSQCKKRQGAAWRAENPGKAKDARDRWAAKNHEIIKAKRSLWRAENPEKVKAISAQYRAENHERVRANHARWSAENRERVRAGKARWRAENTEKLRAIGAKKVTDLSDYYVAMRLGISLKELPKDLLELKRIHLQILRQLKEAK